VFDTLVLLHINNEYMQRFLDEVSKQHLKDRIVKILD